MLYNSTGMSPQELREARQQKGWSQRRAAARLGFSQPYLSMLEVGHKFLLPHVARKAAQVYSLPATVLPPSQPQWTPASADPQLLAEQLAALGYPGFTYLRPRRRRKNPGEVLLTALAQENLEARLTEALPWLVLRYWNLDAGWLVSQAKLHDLQNRLGYVVSLALGVAEGAGALDESRSQSLTQLKASLEHSRLAQENTLCQASMSERERQWLRKNRPDEARHWNLLTDWRPEALRYVA